MNKYDDKIFFYGQNNFVTKILHTPYGRHVERSGVRTSRGTNVQELEKNIYLIFWMLLFTKLQPF